MSVYTHCATRLIQLKCVNNEGGGSVWINFEGEGSKKYMYHSSIGGYPKILKNNYKHMSKILKTKKQILSKIKRNVIVQCPNCEVKLLRKAAGMEHCNVCEKDVEMKLVK